jgi:dihydrofolate reductase
MANIVYIATSLDGFIAREDGNIDWLNAYPNPDNSDHGYFDFIRRIDAYVMGRNTWQTVLSFPEFPDSFYTKPIYVLSASLKTIPDAHKHKAEIFSGSLDALAQLLAQRGHHNIYVDGGKIIQSFLAEDRIDEMVISRIPILIGKGIPLFGPLQRDLLFEHVKTETFTNGITQSRYLRKRS